MDIYHSTQYQNYFYTLKYQNVIKSNDNLIFYIAGVNEFRQCFVASGKVKEIKRISKPGIRVYSKIKELPKPYGGLGISIISTPKGVMSDQNARVKNVGGEILCEVF